MRAKAVSGVTNAMANQTKTWQEVMKELGVYVTIWSAVLWLTCILGCFITSFDRVTLIFYSVLAVVMAILAIYTLVRLR